MRLLLCCVLFVWAFLLVGAFTRNVTCDTVCRARELGLEAQWHTVHVTDGVIVKLARVQRAGTIVGRQPCRPVLLSSGLLQGARSWFDAGDTALATLLAATTDLWLLETRGSAHSRPNTTQQWRFTANDIGRLDLPAVIDHILKITYSTTLTYIGYSHGGGTFFIMCSERPEYCKKINIMIALAPATRLLHTRSELFRFLAEIYEKNIQSFIKFGVLEAFPVDGLANTLLNIVCGLPEAGDRLCEKLKDLLDARNPGSISSKNLQRLLEVFPAGTSVHNMAWFGQMLKSKHFQKFDYGPDLNLAYYGSKDPPKYNFSAVTTPTVVIYGKNDGLVDEKDIKWLVDKLPNVVKVYEMEDPLWTHVDFVLSKNISKLLYPKIKQYL